MKWLSVLFLSLLSYEILASYPWPLNNFKIGHTINSYQKIDGGAAYFHHGVDIVAEKNAMVYSCTGGMVKRIGNYGDDDDELYYEVVIQDDLNNLWKYHHLDEIKISPEIKNAYRNHTRIESGTYIGKLITWPFKMQGKPFHHLHLDIIDNNKNYLNPMDFLDPLIDPTPPEIVNLQLVKLKTGYTITLEAFDYIDNFDFYHPPYKIELSVDAEPVRTVWDFSRLPGGSDKSKFIEDFYMPKITQGDYDKRKYVINLGFNKNKVFQFPSTPGYHSVRVLVYDYNHQVTPSDFSWEIK